MHVRILFGVFAIGVLTILMSPVGYGQFPGGGGGGFGGKGAGGAGGFGGKGKGQGRDPNQSFDLLANGRTFILVSDVTSPFMQQMLTQYQQEKGNFPNGQVTREQYIAAIDFAKAKLAAGGGMFKSGPKGPGAAPGGAPGGAMPSLETMQQMADIEFKSLDENSDNKLNQDEMPPQLKRDLARWDKNGDGFIDQNEYREYYVTRMQERMNRGGNGSPGMQPPGNAVDAAIEDDLDKRPTVYRAGKLPAKGLPVWFVKLDTDTDGQVALYEWRAGGFDLDEFGDWDLDNDGFITPEEALKVQAVLTKTANPLLAGASDGTLATALPGQRGPGNFQGKGPGGFQGKGPGGFQGKGPGGGGKNWGGGNNPGMGGADRSAFGGKKGGGKKGGGNKGGDD